MDYKLFYVFRLIPMLSLFTLGERWCYLIFHCLGAMREESRRLTCRERLCNKDQPVFKDWKQSQNMKPTCFF